MEVQLVSPEQVLYTGEAEMVVARTLGGGEIAFLRDHAPFIGALDNAAVRVQTPDGEMRFAVHGGFVEVSANRVIILSDVAETPEAIDLERAFLAKARAEEVLRAEPEDYDATIALQRAETRIAVAQEHRA